MHFAKKQTNIQAFANLHNRAIILFRRRRQYFLQEVFVRFYILIKIIAAKVRINFNFTGDKGFRILLLLSHYILFIVEKLLSTGADVPGVGLYWLSECLTGTFWLTDRDAGAKTLNPHCPG